MKKERDIKRNNWEAFFWDLQTKGRLTFSYNELQERLNLSYNALIQGLHRYKEKQQIVQIRKSFYAIIPPEYSNQGMLPPALFIDDLMKSLDKEYYVGGISAAALYGAAHQQPMEFFVVVKTPAPRSIRNKKLKITFINKKEWSNNYIIQKKTKSGYINVSTPEYTALDLIVFQSKIGLNRVVSILEELVQEMTSFSLIKTIEQCNNISILQRLGYILDVILNENELSKSVFNVLNLKKALLYVPLSIKKERKGELNTKWKIIINIEIETDL